MPINLAIYITEKGHIGFICKGLISAEKTIKNIGKLLDVFGVTANIRYSILEKEIFSTKTIVGVRNALTHYDYTKVIDEELVKLSDIVENTVVEKL